MASTTAEPPREAARPLRWGLIGTSGFADYIFAPALRNARQEILGAAGSEPDHSADFAGRHDTPRSYETVADLLRDPEVEAVWVASPNHLHAAHVDAALSAGKHVLAEKPLATTGADAARVARRAGEAGLRLAVGYQNRFHPGNQDLAAVIREGELGRIAFVRVSWQTQYASLPHPWRLHPETSGGWALMDIGTHLLDAALWLTRAREPRLLGARLSTVHWPVEVDDFAVLGLELGTATGVIEAATGVQAPPNRIEVYGTAGWAIATDTFVPRLGPAGGRLVTSRGSDQSYREGANPYEAQVRAFAAWVAGGDWAGATGEEGALNVALLEAARGRRE